jgi:chaperonin GroES
MGPRFQFHSFGELTMSTAVEITFQAIGERIVVRPEPAPDKSPGGILMPDQAKEKPNRGLVVAVGSGHLTRDGQRIPLDVKVGDTVLYSSYGGSKVDVDDEEYVVMNEADVLLVL